MALPVGPVDDPAEREADRVAQRALSGAPAGGLLQRACGCGGTPGPDGECAECRARRLSLQGTGDGGGPALAPPIVHEVLASQGRPLDTPTRSFFEQRLGVDLSRVHVHTDSRAAASARAVAASAYTVGADIVFGTNQYAPGTVDGNRLLAHELVHVAQQEAGPIVRRDGPADAACGATAPPGLACSADCRPGLRGLDILFPQEGSTLTGSQKRSLDAYGGAHLADTIEVHGYASIDGDAGYNWRLSCARAEAIRDELVSPPPPSVGVPAASVTIFMHGETAEFGMPLSSNRVGIVRSTAAPGPTPVPSPTPTPTPTPTPAPLCPRVPTSTPATCADRHRAYCAAALCFPANPWLACACIASGDVCRAAEAFKFESTEGVELAACAWVSSAPGTTIYSKGMWLLATNYCIWGHWRTALEAIHDPLRPVPTGLTAEWAAAVTICRASGVGSSACCRAHVEAEQRAIDACGPYTSTTFGRLPTDVPGAPTCSSIIRALAPARRGDPFTGDFGNAADRISYGNRRCCP